VNNDEIVSKTVRYFLRRYPDAEKDKEDLIQEGYVALLSRLRKNPDSSDWSLKLKIYLHLRRCSHRNKNLIVWTEYLDSLKKEEVDKKMGERPVIFLPQERLEEIAEEKESVLDPEWISRLHAAIDCLRSRDALIVRGILAGRTYANIAKELGVSVCRVGQMSKVSMSKLQVWLHVYQLDWFNRTRYDTDKRRIKTRWH
jgi:RNA polymerase sigma factor (sigma-70 family)